MAGIPEAEFVVLYLALTVVTGAAVVLVRRWLRPGRSGNPRAIGADLEPRPAEVAQLNGGPRLAVLTALGALRAAGSVEATDDGHLHALEPPPATIGPLARAVYTAVQAGTTGQALERDAGVRAVLDRTARRLVSGGLLVGAARRRAQRLVALALVAVVAFGAARWFVEEHAALAVLVPLVALATTGLLVRIPRRTLTGDRVLLALRAMHASALAPRPTKGRTPPKPDRAALGVALFGVPALAATDPHLATALGSSRLGRLGAPFSSWSSFGVPSATYSMSTWTSDSSGHSQWGMSGGDGGGPIIQ